MMKSNDPVTGPSRPLNVFITVDTELWPCTPDWRETALSQEIDRLILGETEEGGYGVPFQIEMLNRYGLKAVFFVEALFASAAGSAPLARIVNMIQKGGQEIQLHIHTEWLEKMDRSVLPGKRGRHMKDFCLEDQIRLIAQGIENLGACGVRNLSAFRAGNYGANLDTLTALSRNGIAYDTSYNLCYLDSYCGISTPDFLVQPQRINGVYEFPISFFRDYPGHYRHAQLCACSSLELENALIGAWRQGWYLFVLVLHSFELVSRRNRYKSRGSVNRIVAERFERLCRFLANNRDRFRTALFSEIEPAAIPAAPPFHPLRSRMVYTGLRFIEQLRSGFSAVGFLVSYLMMDCLR